MRWYKIWAIIYSDLMLLRNTKWRVVEYFYMPLTTIIIWGLFALFVKDSALEAGLIVLIVNVLWAFANLAQSHTNQQINEDSWSGSLKQIIISGVSDFEYITSRLISATMFSIIVLFMMLLVAAAFGLSIVAVQWQFFTMIIVATLIASIALSILIAAAMIGLGREYSFLAWTSMQIFILLSAPFYPVNAFPDAIRPVIQVMPYTYIFEASRTAIGSGAGWDIALKGLAVSAAYLLASLPIYKYIFRKAREKGWIVRLS